MKNTEIEINDNIYYVLVPETEEEFKIGLSKHTKLAEDEGMLFCYPETQKQLMFTMRETSLDLDIIFIDEDGDVISVHPSKAHQEKMIKERYAKYVLEVPINSGIQVGDELSELEDLNEEDREYASKNKMLVLDENGDVQMKLEGGERIVSRIETRKLIKQALRAYRTDSDIEYIKLGKMIFKIFKNQDEREPEYVEKP